MTTFIRLGVANKSGNFPDSKGLKRVPVSAYISYCPDYSLLYPTVSPDFLDKFGGYFGDLFELDSKECHIVTKTKYHFTISLTDAEESPIIADLGNSLRIMSKEDSIKFKFSPCEKEYETVSEFSTLKFINMGDDSKQTDFVFGPNCKEFCKIVKKFGVKNLSDEDQWKGVMRGTDYVLSTNNKYLRKGGRRWNAMKALSDFYKNLDDDEDEDEEDDDCDCDEDDDEDDEDDDEDDEDDEEDDDEDDEDDEEDDDEDDDDDCGCDDEEKKGGAKAKAPVSVQKGASSNKNYKRAAKRAAKNAAKKAAKMSAGAHVTPQRPVGGAPLTPQMRVGGAHLTPRPYMRPVGGSPPTPQMRVGGAPLTPRAYMRRVGGAPVTPQNPVSKTGGASEQNVISKTIKKLSSVFDKL